MSYKNLTPRIMDYETGSLVQEEIIELFQELVDSGMAWKLQGHYGRVAKHFLEAGMINPPDPGYRIKEEEEFPADTEDSQAKLESVLEEINNAATGEIKNDV